MYLCSCTMAQRAILSSQHAFMCAVLDHVNIIVCSLGVKLAEEKPSLHPGFISPDSKDEGRTIGLGATRQTVDAKACGVTLVPLIRGAKNSDGGMRCAVRLTVSATAQLLVIRWAAERGMPVLLGPLHCQDQRKVARTDFNRFQRGTQFRWRTHTSISYRGHTTFGHVPITSAHCARKDWSKIHRVCIWQHLRHTGQCGYVSAVIANSQFGRTLIVS